MKKTKKRILSAITSVLLVSTMLACTMMTASASGLWSDGSMDTTQSSPNTKKGNSYAIQTILKRLGYTEVGSVDGYFGTNTKSAVINFQRDNDLEDDGIVGINTWTKLGSKLTHTCMRNIIRNSGNVDIGIYDTYKVSGSSTTTDCFFWNIGNDERYTFYNMWLTDNGYSGRGTSGSNKLSSTAMVMNTTKTVDGYSS